ncbi:hypothetical protein Gasu2_10420 [Galdieria sulphuraria]|nr:hypothetical protein Gasu2_10420 [Galdieria sulphuraria]
MQTIYRLKEPQIDREEDVRTIIQTFLFQFSEKAYGGPSFNRPACCFAPHIYGAGKTFVGQNFSAYLNIFAERECSNAQTFQQLHSSNDNPQPSELKVPWKHFAEKTLSVCFKLEESFSDAPFPNTDALQIAERTKQYLFLMIDELSHLSYLTTYYSELTTKQFVESDPRGKVIVYLAGRTAEISAPLSDARSSSVSLHMLRLNPFNLHDINEYIELATYSGKSLKDWLLPSDDLRHRFVELLKKKTGGIPLIVRNTLLALVEKVSNLSQPVINAENMELLLDSVFSSLLLESVTFIIPEILDSATLLRYQFVLLNYQLGTIFPIGFATTLCGTRTYLMDLVATFGFYSEICETDGIDLGAKFKIGCCEFILRAHSNYNFFREATELFPLSPFSYIPDTATAKGVFFEFVFMKIFRFRLLTFLHSSSSPIVHSAIPGIFQGSFIEQDNVSYSMESTKSYDIPILRNVSDSFSDYYRKYLQHCGIFVPKEGNSSGPDAYVVFHNGQTRYVVGFSFKFYHKSNLSRNVINREAEQFFPGVVSVLNNESFSSVQLRFQFVVVCTSYDQSVGFSTEEQNIVEDASRFVTQHSSGSTLNESSRSCLQLVIVSQRNLEIYLGRDNVETLRKIGEANRGEFSKNFSVWCETVFESMSNEYVSPLEQSNVTLRVARNIRPRTNEENRMQMEELQSAMQVEGGDARGEQRVAASSSLSSSFDWNTFLREYCHFTEAPLIERYAHQLRLFSPLSFPYLNDTRLSRYGIAPQDIPLIVDGIHEFLEQQSMNVDLVER